jgi:putative endonuclease
MTIGTPPPRPRPASHGRAVRGKTAQITGVTAEALACAALVADGWTLLGRRLRTAAGEVDAVAEKNGLLAFVEVKRRASLAEAAAALVPRQRQRLLAAGAILLGENPGWGRAGVRFDVIVVDPAGSLRRIADAFRDEG